MRENSNRKTLYGDNTRPTVIKFLCIMLYFLAGMGEWRYINGVYGGLPKAITLGIIGIAVLYALVKPETDRLRAVTFPSVLYFCLIIAILLWSIVIWEVNLSEKSEIIAGCSKLAFQSIAVLTAISTVYLFGSEAVNLFATGLCLTNMTIMLLELFNFGIVASVQSLLTCLFTFGEASGYARAIEIHDVTYVFGQLVIYYAGFAPRITEKEKTTRRRLLAACIFFFIIGMKRIAIPAVILVLIVSAMLKRREKLFRTIVTLGCVTVVFFFVFLYLVRNGYVTAFLSKFGINMMGRDFLWSKVNEYYDLSVTYIGHGLEYVDVIVGEWYDAGLINHAYPLHNDILKAFVELGFPGFCIWSGLQYIAFPIFWYKFADKLTSLLYMSLLLYMTFTYLTDNTAFYFWSTLSLRLIVLSYSVTKKTGPEVRLWKPMSREEVREHIRLEMQNNGGNNA